MRRIVDSLPLWFGGHWQHFIVQGYVSIDSRLGCFRIVSRVIQKLCQRMYTLVYSWLCCVIVNQLQLYTYSPWIKRRRRKTDFGVTGPGRFAPGRIQRFLLIQLKLKHHRLNVFNYTHSTVCVCRADLKGYSLTFHPSGSETYINRWNDMSVAHGIGLRLNC